jgi:hypothetical protein
MQTLRLKVNIFGVVMESEACSLIKGHAGNQSVNYSFSVIDD